MRVESAFVLEKEAMVPQTFNRVLWLLSAVSQAKEKFNLTFVNVTAKHLVATDGVMMFVIENGDLEGRLIEEPGLYDVVKTGKKIVFYRTDETSDLKFPKHTAVFPKKKGYTEIDISKGSISEAIFKIAKVIAKDHALDFERMGEILRIGMHTVGVDSKKKSVAYFVGGGHKAALMPIAPPIKDQDGN